MNEARLVPKAGESGWLWLIKLLTGLGIVILLLVHFVVNHYIGKEGLLRHNEVVAYYANPLIILMEAVFLVFVISHALIGIRSIILDLGPSVRALRAADIVLVLLGIGFTAYGIWILQAVLAYV